MNRNIFRLIIASPILYWTYLIVSQQLGPDPAKNLTVQIGEMSLYFILLNCALGALIDFKLNWPQWLRPILQLRRFLGVTTFFFLCGHVLLYFVMESFGVHAIEQILTKTYLIFGSLGFSVIFILGITSNNFSVQRLGIKSWKRLHRLVHIATLLIAVHVMLIEKTDLIKYGLIFLVYGLLQSARVSRIISKKDLARR